MLRILSLGLDKSVLDPNSKTAKRIAEYKNLVEKYIVLVPDKRFKPLALFDLYKRSKDIVKKEDINVITVQDQYFIGLLGYFLARKYNIGLNIQIHGFEKFFGIRKLIAKFVISRANSIRVVSQRLRIQLINDFGVNKDKITVVPIFVDIDSSSRAERSNYGKDSNKFIFLTVGRLVPVKNIGLQIEALAELVKQLNVRGQKLNVELWIIGDGPERKSCESLVVGRRLEKNVVFLGWQENLSDYYSQADAFLLTSNSEGWGMSVIEAAGFGLPIIMTNVGLAEEVIINNVSGLIIPINDKQQLIQAMFKLIESKDLRSRLADGAIEAVKKMPSKEEILVLYKESWQKALK